MSEWYTYSDGIRLKDVQTADGLYLGLIQMDQGLRIPMHTHREAETYSVQRGLASVNIEGEAHLIEPGETVFIGPYVSHELYACSSCEVYFTFPTHWHNVQYNFK